MSKIWGVRGVDPSRRKAVAEAAKQAEVTIGEWLNAAIDRQLSVPSPPSRYEEILKKLEDHEERISNLQKAVVYGFRGTKKIK
jgi:predicted RNase H-like HicB family nuclease